MIYTTEKERKSDKRENLETYLFCFQIECDESPNSTSTNGNPTYWSSPSFTFSRDSHQRKLPLISTVKRNLGRKKKHPT